MFWVLVVVCEILFWLFLGSFALTRYWYGRRRASMWFLVAILVNELWLVPFAVWDAMTFGRFSIFHVDVLFEAVALPVIFLVARRSFLERLDRGAKEYVSRVRVIMEAENTRLPQAVIAAIVRPLREHDAMRVASHDSTENVPDLDHARRQRRNWLIHLAVFILGQGLIQLAVLGNFLDPSTGLVFGNDPANARIYIGPVAITPDIDGLRKAWLVLLIIHFLWSFSYTLWPKKRAVEHES